MDGMTARSVIIAALLVLLPPAQSAITQDDGHQVSFDDVVAAANSNKSFEEAIAEQLNSRGASPETPVPLSSTLAVPRARIAMPPATL